MKMRKISIIGITVFFLFLMRMPQGNTGRQEGVRLKNFRVQLSFQKKKIKKQIRGRLRVLRINVNTLRDNQLLAVYVLKRFAPKCFRTVKFTNALRYRSLRNFLKEVARQAFRQKKFQCLRQILDPRYYCRSLDYIRRTLRLRFNDRKCSKANTPTISVTMSECASICFEFEGIEYCRVVSSKVWWKFVKSPYLSYESRQCSGDICILRKKGKVFRFYKKGSSVLKQHERRRCSMRKVE